MLKLNEQLKFRCENDGKYIYWDLKCVYTLMIAISKPFVPLKSFLQIQKAVKQPQQSCENTYSLTSTGWPWWWLLFRYFLSTKYDQSLSFLNLWIPRTLTFQGGGDKGFEKM